MSGELHQVPESITNTWILIMEKICTNSDVCGKGRHCHNFKCKDLMLKIAESIDDMLCGGKK